MPYVVRVIYYQYDGVKCIALNILHLLSPTLFIRTPTNPNPNLSHPIFSVRKPDLRHVRAACRRLGEVGVHRDEWRSTLRMMSGASKAAEEAEAGRGKRMMVAVSIFSG